MSTTKMLMLSVILLMLAAPVFPQDVSQSAFELIDAIPDVSTFEWLYTQNKMVVVQNRQSICLWSQQSQQCDTLLSYDNTWSVNLSPDGAYLAIGLDHDVKVIDMRSQVELANFKILDAGQGNGIQGIAWSPQGEYLAIGGKGTIHIFSTENWNEVKILPIPPDVAEPFPNLIWNLEWSPSGHYLASEYPSVAGTMSVLDVLEVNSGNPVYHGSSRDIGWISNEEGEFFSYLAGQGVMLIDTKSFEKVREYLAWNARSMSWSPGGEFFVLFSNRRR